MLILQEIRYAEQQIRYFKDAGEYKLAIKILPTNNRHSNIHLFIQDLKETEIDLISKFYSKSEYVDKIVENISNLKNKQLIPVNHTKTVSQDQIQITQQQAQTQYQTQSQNFQMFSQILLGQVTNSIEFIYNTPVVEKLRHISKKKVFRIF